MHFQNIIIFFGVILESLQHYYDCPVPAMSLTSISQSISEWYAYNTFIYEWIVIIVSDAENKTSVISSTSASHASLYLSSSMVTLSTLRWFNNSHYLIRTSKFALNCNKCSLFCLSQQELSTMSHRPRCWLSYRRYYISIRAWYAKSSTALTLGKLSVQ